MLKVVASVRRRPGMTYAEFIDYIVNVHGEMAVAKPLGLFRYTQNHVVDSAFSTGASGSYADVANRDSVTELLFQSPDDMKRTFSDEYTITVIAPDGPKFSELSTTDTAFTIETILQEPVKEGTTKILHFLYPKAGDTAENAQHSWSDAHARALERVPAFAAALQGLVRSDSKPFPDPRLSEHFGAAGRRPFAVMLSFFIPADKLSDFRAYEAQILASGQFDLEHSHFLQCREHQIYPQ